MNYIIGFKIQSYFSIPVESNLTKDPIIVPSNPFPIRTQITSYPGGLVCPTHCARLTGPREPMAGQEGGAHSCHSCDLLLAMDSFKAPEQSNNYPGATPLAWCIVSGRLWWPVLLSKCVFLSS